MKLDPDHELDASTVQFLTSLSASIRDTTPQLREEELLAFAGGWCDAPTAARVMDGVTCSAKHRQRLIELKKELNQLSAASLPELLTGAVRKALAHYSKAASLLATRPWSAVKGEVDEESKAFQSVLRSLTSAFETLNANKIAFSRSASAAGVAQVAAEISEAGDLLVSAKVAGSYPDGTNLFLFLQAPGGNSVLLGQGDVVNGVFELKLEGFGTLLRLKPGFLSSDQFRIGEDREAIESVSAVPLFESDSSRFITMLRLSEPPRITNEGVIVDVVLTEEVLKRRKQNLTAVFLLGELSVPLASWPIESLKAGENRLEISLPGGEETSLELGSFLRFVTEEPKP